MKNLGQKIERVDDATNEIMDKIRVYFWEKLDIDLRDYAYNHNNDRDADTEIYSIIHNKLKEII